MARSSELPPRYREHGSTIATSEWLDGFCAVTEESAASVEDSCARDDQGSVPLGAKFNIRTRQACVDFCFTRCKRCRYVSFSKELGDCSWYHRCDLSALRRNINGGGNLPIQTRRVEANVTPRL